MCSSLTAAWINWSLEKSFKIMEEPILNAHNKAEFEPAHTDAFDTYPF